MASPPTNPSGGPRPRAGAAAAEAARHHGSHPPGASPGREGKRKFCFPKKEATIVGLKGKSNNRWIFLGVFLKLEEVGGGGGFLLGGTGGGVFF